MSYVKVLIIVSWFVLGISNLSGQIMTCHVVDIEGNIYPVVKIGSQEWMAKNLCVSHYRDGSPINFCDTPLKWSNALEGAFCIEQGFLYNWYAVHDNRNICPNGFHIPRVNEWTILENTLGKNAGGKMKVFGIWQGPNIGADNLSEFTAIPDGFRYPGGNYSAYGQIGCWWSSTEDKSGKAWNIYVSYDVGTTNKASNDMQNGYSVRCIKD